MKAAARLGLLFVLPALGVLIPITLYPMLYGIWMAFTDYRVSHIRRGEHLFAGLSLAVWI